MTNRLASYGSRTLLSMLFLMLQVFGTVSAQTGERFSFEFRNDPLDHALYMISQATGIGIIYESNLTAGVRVSAVYREELIGPILDNLLQPTGLEARRIHTGMYVVRYSLRSELEPILSLSGGIGTITPGIRDKDRIRTNRPPGPLRDRIPFWK